MKKKKRGIQLTINLTDRWLYTLIAIGMLVIMAVGVYAWTNPTTGVGHDLSEIEPCLNGQILQTSAGTWSCVDMPVGAVETDPTVLASVKDGVSWGEVTSIPAGFADGVDADTHGSLSCTTRSTTAGSTCNNICSSSGERCVSAYYSTGAFITCEFDQPSGYLYYCRCCKVV